MKKTAKTKQKYAYGTIIIGGGVAWVMTIVYPLYLWLVLSDIRGSMTATFWIANGTMIAISALLPLCVGWVTYKRLDGMKLKRVAYATLIGFGVGCAYMALQTILSIISTQFFLSSIFGNNYWVSTIIQQLLIVGGISCLAAWFLRRVVRQKNPAMQYALARRGVATVAAASLGLFIVETLLHILQQYPTNTNMSGFVPALTGYGVLLVLCVPAFVAARYGKGKEPLTSAILTTMFFAVVLNAIAPLSSRLSDSTMQLPTFFTAIIMTIGILAAMGLYIWTYKSIQRILS